MKRSRRRRNVSKNGLVSDRNIPSKIPVPFFLQDFFNLSLLPDSVFCGHFLVTGTDLCKLKVDKNPKQNLPVPSFALPFTLTYPNCGFFNVNGKTTGPVLIRQQGGKFAYMKSMANWLSPLIFNAFGQGSLTFALDLLLIRPANVSQTTHARIIVGIEYLNIMFFTSCD